jgi:hypothetical protein
MMSWLDDMEAADPAYPSPGDEDPWAASDDSVPDTSRGLPAEIGNAIGEWARQQNAPAFSEAQAYSAAADAVGLFLEYWDTHGLAEDEAQPAALDEVGQGLSAWADELTARRGSVPDWRAIQEAESHTREIGLRASVPQPDGQDTPEYRADAEAWGTGRGIGPDGPEAGE